MLTEVLEVLKTSIPVEVGVLSPTAKTVVMAEDWGLCRYNSTRPALIPKGTAIGGSMATKSEVAVVVV